MRVQFPSQTSVNNERIKQHQTTNNSVIFDELLYKQKLSQEEENRAEQEDENIINFDKLKKYGKIKSYTYDSVIGKYKLEMEHKTILTINGLLHVQITAYEISQKAEAEKIRLDEISKAKLKEDDNLQNVTYNPITGEYKLDMKYKKITSDKPITAQTLIERRDKLQSYFESDFFKTFQAEKRAHNKKIYEGNPDYEPSRDSRFFKEKDFIDSYTVILDGEMVKLHYREWENYNSAYKGFEDSGKWSEFYDENIGGKPLPRPYYEFMRVREENWDTWREQSKIRTEENMYEDAPEFETFVTKWMLKGESKEEVLQRAKIYAETGLLDYGKQKAVTLDLPYGDMKEHGMHLVNNDVLKQTLLETFDSLDLEGVHVISNKIFGRGQFRSLDIDVNSKNIFQALLNEFGMTLKDAMTPTELERQEFLFDGNINITKETSARQKDFIFDTLVKYLKHNIKDLENAEKNTGKSLQNRKDFFNLLIENLEKNIIEERSTMSEVLYGEGNTQINSELNEKEFKTMFSMS